MLLKQIKNLFLNFNLPLAGYLGLPVPDQI